MSSTGASSAAASAQPFRRGFGRRLGPKLLLLATLILIVDALVGDKGLLERLKEHQRFEEASSALDKLRHENTMLREQARRLREEDPATIESAARRQLGMIKPGEVLFIVKDVDGDGEGRASSAPATAAKRPATPPSQPAGKP